MGPSWGPYFKWGLNVFLLDQSCTDPSAAKITFVDHSCMVTTRTVGSLLLNGHETAVLFSSQNGINILEARSEPGVESVFFLSEIGSGFLEPGGTPPPRIRRSTPGFPLFEAEKSFLFSCEPYPFVQL